MNEISSPAEKLTLLKSNKILVLNDPQSFWLFQAGAIALFSLPYREGKIAGSRRYLYSPEIGDLLFGLPPQDPPKSKFSRQSENPETATYAIVAVTLTESNFLQLTPTEAKTWGQENPNALSRSVNRWTNNLTEAIAHLPSIARDRLAFAMEAEDWQGQLETWHRHLIQCLREGEEQERERQRERLAAREERDRYLLQGSLQELASTIQRRETEELRETEPLLIAAGAVGRALGIPISPPASSEDLKRIKDPLQAIARASQIRTRRILLEGKWWRSDCGPLLAYGRDDGRPLALLPVSPSRYELFDPETRRRSPVNAKTQQELEPFAHTFYRSLLGETISTFEFLRFLLQDRQKDMLAVILAGVFGTLLGMLTPQATAILIDSAIPDGDRGLLVQIGLGLLAANFGRIIFQLARGLAVLRLETAMDATSQAALWDRLLKLPLSFFRLYSTGDIQSRVSAIGQIRRVLSGQVLQTFLTGLFSLLNLILLLVYDLRLALVAVVLGAIATIFSTIMSAIVRRKLLPLAEIRGELASATLQLIGGVSKLRVAGAEARAFSYWSKTYTRLLEWTLQSQYAQDLLSLSNTLLPNIGRIVLFVTAAALIAREDATLSTGTFLAFNAAFGIFLQGTTRLSGILTEVINALVLWERAKPILQTPPELLRDRSDPGPLRGEVKLDRISFRYRDDGPLTLEDVTIAAKPGEFIALVGPSGSGKSTIVRLLLGFERPEEGAIYYDGQDLSGLDIAAVRRQLGVVLQQGRINSASIFDLISGGALITMDEAWKAARRAGFDRDIETMPMGMHTVISEGGTNLSGGQRQRLLIARSLALDPKIVIFDEATSALDNRTQAIVSQNLEQLDVTRIVIAHRLSTIRNADRIYVLEAGRLLQQGTFEELIERPGLFANLMTRQMA
ncbi:MAG: NHLP bacteriocin export ABC transporter permease/ATPase subunit [Cyanobacteria bacterium SBLK]|nr:NHLP bacteriocin export ABC transporter permease/ATPase subunit [Cyanobacteria bacterium SBLK]